MAETLDQIHKRIRKKAKEMPEFLWVDGREFQRLPDGKIVEPDNFTPGKSSLDGEGA